MDIEKVIQDLNRRFAAPLPEYYHRRIIFWHDEDREFEDKLDEIQLDNAQLVALTGNNTFMVKKLLSYDDLTSNYLVYNPLSFDKPDDDWLIDMKLYSEEFRADLISMWMDEMGVASNFSMRKEVKHYTGQFYNQKQIEELFRIVKGDPVEFGVITAAFYGLRRSEILGLRWNAIDFEEKTITIRHTLHEVRVNGKMKIVAFDTTKTKSSFRTLPLVPPFEEILLKMKREQEENRRLCGNCYCQEYLGYIYVNEIGDIMKPNFLTAHFSAVLKENDMPHIRFHDLRHSCASLLFAQGVSLKEIQAWLGHSTIGTTANIYTHLDENNKLSSANAILSILTDK